MLLNLNKLFWHYSFTHSYTICFSWNKYSWPQKFFFQGNAFLVQIIITSIFSDWRHTLEFLSLDNKWKQKLHPSSIFQLSAVEKDCWFMLINMNPNKFSTNNCFRIQLKMWTRVKLVPCLQILNIYNENQSLTSLYASCWCLWIYFEFRIQMFWCLLQVHHVTSHWKRHWVFANWHIFRKHNTFQILYTYVFRMKCFHFLHSIFTLFNKNA